MVRIRFSRTTRHNAPVTERVLLIRLSALGDIVVTLPALPLLRAARPDLTIDWLVEDRFAALLGEVEGIDRVLVYPRKKLSRPTWRTPITAVAHWRALRRGGWSTAVDLQGNMKSAMQLELTRAPRKIGPDRGAAKEGAHRSANVRVPIPAGCHRIERVIRLLEPLGVQARDAFDGIRLAGHAMPRFRRHPGAEAATASALGDDPRPITVVHPGTSRAAAFKRWPPARFGEFATTWQQGGARRVIVTHGPGEEDLANAVVAATGGRNSAELFPPAGGIAGLIALFRRASLVVAADSGPLFLASALGRPTVALFGPKDPAIYAPPFGRSRVVRESVPCSPCSLRDCDDPICMKRLEPAAVNAAATELLARSNE